MNFASHSSIAKKDRDLIIPFITFLYFFSFILQLFAFPSLYTILKFKIISLLSFDASRAPTFEVSPEAIPEIKEEQALTEQPAVVFDDNSKEIPPNYIVIPRLHVSAPIVYIETTEEKAQQEALQNGVLRYFRTAPVGQKGNTVLLGHSSDFLANRGDYKTVFASLPEIKKGDLVYLTNDHTLFSYQIMNTDIIKPEDVFILDQRHQEDYFLTLVTSYPINSALRRFIAEGQLISTDSL